MKTFISVEEVNEFAKTNKRTLVHHQSNVFDVTEFLDHHPGGVNSIKG